MEKFLVVADGRTGTDRAPYMADETRAVQAFRERGMIEERYLHLEATVSYTVVVAESAEAARAVFEQLPFFEHGVVKIDDLFPVTQVLASRPDPGRREAAG
jgi:hypothetical protein